MELTLQQCKDARAQAGANYQAAVAALRNAYIELAVLDAVTQIAGGGASIYGLKSFHEQLHMPPTHPDFQAEPFGNMSAVIKARIHEIAYRGAQK